MKPESLRALFANLIDYAGLYPPASLPLDCVIANYRRYLASPDAWILNRLVLPFDKLRAVTLAQDWRITLLVNEEPGTLPKQVECLETKSGKRLSLPTYCEVPLAQLENGYAKIRTAAISEEALADFLLAAASRRVRFKATAGLHHAMASPARPDRCGFLNVFVAATFAWTREIDREMLIQLVAESNATAFEFTNQAVRWRDCHATVEQIRQARREFAHSFGSCSFEEPVSDLRELGLLE
jgi:hypothetical protein